ncbi:MAG: dihydroneopterin aldolase [Verrucomicrobiae bacterium]|nr:dihydroneopterin aldolase [Verrucomicrobiae bacterium]MDW8308232.1 dihydroneopterin aldolase [Verrucomicrobiales bacterium]
MSKITIADLEVFYCLGVPDEERAQPQRLLLTVEMEFDFGPAVLTDRVTKTIDYQAVAQFLLRFGEGRSWKLLEKLTTDLADAVVNEFHPDTVNVEVKKFALPQARYVSATVSRARTGPGILKKAAWGIP